MLIELDAVNDALGEHANSARGRFYLRVLIHLLHRCSEFVPLAYEGRDLLRYTKGARATFAEERGGQDHNPGKGFHAPLAFLYPAFDAHPVIGLRHQVCACCTLLSAPCNVS